MNKKERKAMESTDNKNEDDTPKKKKSKGVGDTVSKVIKKVSGGKIKECGPCKKRKELLNKMFPYKKRQRGGPDF